MWRPSWVRRTALLLVGAVAVLVLDLAFTATTYAAALRRSNAELRAAIGALDDSDATGAALHLSRATAAAGLATVRAGRPSLDVLRGLGLSDDVDALEVVAETAAGVTGSAQHIVGATFAHGSAERGFFGALYDDGAVDLDALTALRAGLGSLELDLARAQSAVSAAQRPVLGPIRRGVERLQRRLGRARGDVERAIEVADLVPPLLGGAGPRSYLLALQSPSEARGGGGLIGVYGVLDAEDGRLDLAHVGAIEELVDRMRNGRERNGRARGSRAAEVSAPGWFRDLYENFLALEDIRHANLTPSFPASSDVLLDMYRAATGDSLDGVIALDPLALGELIRGTGPLRAPGWDRTIRRFNARRVLLHDIYRHFDLKERKQNEYLRGLIDELWARLSSGEVRAGGLVRGLAAATREQHLKIYATDPAVAESLSELQIDGDYRSAGPNVQLVFHNNFSASKVDFFLERHVATRIALQPDGSARVVTTIELVNQAPEATSVLVRPLRRDLGFGTNRMTLGFLLPQGAEPERLTIDRRDSNFFSGREYDYPVAWQILDVERGDSRTVRLTWQWPAAWDPPSMPGSPNPADPASDAASDVSPEFELTLWPQALVRPDFASLTIVPPTGYRLRGRPFVERDLRWRSGESLPPRTLTLRWRHRPPVTIALDVTAI